MPPKCSDEGVDALMPLMKRHMQRPFDIAYREAQHGVMNRETLVEWLVMLMQLPAQVKQKNLAATLSEWASCNEATWHLAGETEAWSTSTAKKIRAMRKDVTTLISKTPKRAKWFTQAVERLGIDIDGVPADPDEADEIDVDEANAKSEPPETEATSTAQSADTKKEKPLHGMPAETTGKYIYRFDEDCQAHSYG